mgnify:CR=1 FL=1
MLILGGGFAGVYCGKELARRCRRDPDFRVGLVSDENYMVFQPMLPEVAAASISPRHVVNTIRQLCRGLLVYKAEVTSIDPEAKEVRLSAGDFTSEVIFKYKQLVLAMGAKIDLSRVPGMSEHSLLMQNVGDAMKLRAKIIGRFEEANLVREEDRKRQLLSFVVVGGGYSGVETAGGIYDLMTSIHRYYDNIGDEDYSVTLVHSGEHLLPTLSRKLGEYTATVLEKAGVKLILQKRVKAVTANCIILSDGQRLQASTVISTVGNAPHPLILKLAEQMDVESVRGRIRTNPHLQVNGRHQVWAVGDCAAVPLDEDNFCPPTAQFAQRQGRHAGRNILAVMDGHRRKPFEFKGLGELAAIGHHKAVADIMGLSFSGFLAWWAWRTIYLAKLPGLQRKLRVLLDWTFDLFFPRDINLLSPQYSKPLKSIHMEAGDVLFYPDEPAFSVYFVQSGKIEIRDGETVIKTVGAGEYFGERAILNDQVWRYQAVAADSSELVAIGAPEFRAIVDGSKALEALFQRSALAYGLQEDYSHLKERIGDEVLAMPVTELMVREADTLRMDMNFQQALDIFRERFHGSYPVLDGEGKFIGSLRRDTLYDAIKTVGLDSGQTVADLPLSELPVVDDSLCAEEVLDRMNRAGKNKLIVCHADRQFAGLVTVIDILDHRPRKADPALSSGRPAERNE